MDPESAATYGDAHLIANLFTAVSIPEGGILSRTLHADDQVKVVLFAFDTGQELSEHTAAVPAIVHILQGQVRLTYGAEVIEAGPGAWLHMPARLPHSLLARTPLVMLLTLLQAT
ncbi:MAG: cupin domain-containing protein [Chloroflexales bacterium]|nr:cupin domain-containing protein [Chloroflexales bacterium]